jgi:hypothetical protein
VTAGPGDSTAFKLLVAEQLRDPDGSKVLVAQAAVGDLTHQEALDALRRGCESLAAQAPPNGA